jgi:hypothetical protein
MAELLAAVPLSVRSPDDVVTTGTTLPTETLAPAVIGLFHVFGLVEGVMTTDLDAALATLRERAAAAD